MRVLFLGGTGNISSDCAALLHLQGHQISVLTRGRSGVPPEYWAWIADRTDRAAVRRALGSYQPDVVLNFLGYELAEVQTDYDLFHGCGHYIFISSATVYAKPPAQLPIREDAPLGNTFWPYAQKKQACEEWLLARYRDDQFPVTIVRPSLTYSRRWIPNPLSSSSYTFAARLEQGKPVYVPDTGDTPWTVTAASDFACGLAGLIGHRKALGEAFHITSDEVLSWNLIVRQTAEALGAPSPEIVPIPTDFICSLAPEMTGTLKGDKAHPGIFDNAKIKRFVPGFACTKSYRSGVQESVAWLRAHPEDQNRRPELDAMCERVIGAWRQAAGTRG